jgi:putative ABC transport system substrate-binding protein
MIERREFITLLGGTAAWPLAAHAQQQERVRRIGILMGAFASSNPEGQTALAAFLSALQRFGWTQGSNAQIEVRWIADDLEHGKIHAAELVALAPDVIFVSSSAATDMLSHLTSTIPTVFAQVIDPVGNGWVKSLARPGGNITGFALFEQDISSKWLELIKKIAPDVSRVAVLLYSKNAAYARYWQGIEAAAPSLAIKASAVGVGDAGEIENAIAAFASQTDGGLVVLPSPLTNSNHGLITDLAARHRLPAVYPYRLYVISGGLIAYGPDPTDWYGQAASYVDRILRGEKPADLPVQQPTKFNLAINMKTAKALGLKVSDQLLALADEVIE